MLQTKLFTGYFTGDIENRKFIDVDVEMNQFLKENSVELVDIKHTVFVDSEGTPWNNALMIYKVTY